jgi:hypothetical protein
MSFLDDAVGFLSGSGIASTLVKTAALGFLVNRLSTSATKANDTTAVPENIDNGVRLQVEPDAYAKIPVLYGNAFFGGNIIDAAMTNSNKTMWYAIALSEKTGTKYSDSAASAYTFNNIYWNDQRIIFNGDGITANYTQDRGGNIDRSISNQVKVYLYRGGSTAGVVPAGYTGTVPNAYDIFPNWASGTHPMTNLVFALVRVDYNREKNVTGIGNMLFNISNTMFKPGDVLYDYLTNTTYGAGIDSADINTGTISALNTYSDAGVAYADQGTGSQTLADRYQINGVIDTAKPVLENADLICSATASWLSYDSQVGQWGVVINKSGSSIASFNDTNILGNISVSGTGLSDLYNEVKVQFPHRDLRDSADFYKIALGSGDRNANEEDKTLNITYDIINEPVQAAILGFIELKQSRIDLVIRFQTDFGQVNLKAGDIIDVTNSRFAFTSKLFRIITITEVQDQDGALSMDITALQYDSNVYSVADITRYTRSDANGIITIGSIGVPGTPSVTKYEQDARPRIVATSTAPTGVVEGMEFWLTKDVTTADDALRSYNLISTQKPVGGGVYSSGTVVTLDYDSLGATNFLIKTRGFNATTVGPYSDPSGSIYFTPVQVTQGIGPDTQAYNSTGGLLTALALSTLLGKLGDLFGGDASKSLFGKIFDTFKTTTGIDLVGNASNGSLVVASNIAAKSNGTQVSASLASIDFKTPLQATAAGTAVTAKIKNGVKNKDVLAWNKDEQEWQIISDCITCDFPEATLPLGPAEPCFLTVANKYPSNNYTLGGVCQSDSTVPYTGSYFIRFSINPGYKGAEATSSSTISTDSKYTIAFAGNTDWSWWGFSANTVGTVIDSAKAPTILFPDGKKVTVITANKRYKIKIVGTTDFTLIGADSNTVGTEFTATGVGTGTGVVEKANGTGKVYGRGQANAAIPLYAPLVKGVGSFKLYGTDGKLEETITIANARIHNDVVELPFKTRAPGKDYYIVWDAGIVTSCACENFKVDDAETWTFTTSETPRDSYTLQNIGYSSLPADTALDDKSVRTRINFSYTPASSLCSSSQKLVLTFGQKVKKGNGVITIKDRAAQTTIASLSVASATITEDGGNWNVDFGALSGLEVGKYYDVTAPQALLISDSSATSAVVCDQTYNTPATPDRPSVAKTWAFKTDEPLKLVKYELCREANGNARQRTNIVLTFNKSVAIKADSPALVNIYGAGILGGTFQKIDLRGTYANKKYGIISGSTSKTITVNPTNKMDGNSEYYLNIPAGVIIDATCGIEWEGITDSTTVAWKTDGAAASPPEKLTLGSIFFDFNFERPIKPGPGKLNIIAVSDGRLLAQVGSNDIALKSKTTPFTG